MQINTYKNTPVSHLIEHVERLVHDNLINDAFSIAAEFVEHKGLEDEFDAIGRDQAYRGYMTEDALAKRRSLKQRLLDHIETIYGERIRKVFNSLL